MSGHEEGNPVVVTGDVKVLDHRALNRSLLARQLLLERSAMPAGRAVAHLVGMQAQAPNPPYIGLWTRLASFRIEDLASLVRNREVVRVGLMRGTIHLVTADDCVALRPVLQGALRQGLKGAFGRKLEGLDVEKVAELGRELVEREPLTLGGLGTLLAERWPDRDPFALANAVRNLVPLVQVPPRGLWGESGQAVHTSAEAWLGRPVAGLAAPDLMVERYLAAFGPATVKDIQVWSGMTRLADAVNRLRPRLAVFRDENGREVLDLPEAPRPDANTPAPVRFLPEFDNILLSHADRARILTEEQRKLVFTRNGLIRSTFLVDGFVAGVWRVEQTRGAAVLVLEPFGTLRAGDRAALTEEGGRLLAFATASAASREVRFA
ncbi:winged helix DNA-binding domain-containing protein [Streptomyces decoyicus]|uniref:Winged helix DNA-binding domain-containing protein n=1 Tax=Streptomyces decoyicus TaxID=249567 RepID=A0ABZ1FCY7_9ACTN|nr:winged helix DNA-binding domain-containing protein [Streptomyces decoyicus]WSB68214.1 winged helix DNA-binding domain-containing protein [Streptomyces decoyicus]